MENECLLFRDIYILDTSLRNTTELRICSILQINCMVVVVVVFNLLFFLNLKANKQKTGPTIAVKTMSKKRKEMGHNKRSGWGQCVCVCVCLWGVGGGRGVT